MSVNKLKVGTLNQRIARGPTDAEHQALVAERKAIRARTDKPPAIQPVRDILLQKSYEKTLAAAPAIMDRLVRGALDENDPLHERCLDIMSKRVNPIAFYEAMAKQEFRPEEEQNRQPTIVINVNGSAGLEMLEHTPVVDVEPRDE